jgi:hypothetical protein
MGGGTEIRNCVITGNSSPYVESFGGVRTGLGCVVDSCTIAGNVGTMGGGMYVSETLVTNSIIWGNCGDIAGSEDVYGSSGTSFFMCCDVDPTKVSGPVQFVGPQVNADPLFCDAMSCADAPSVEGDYHLTPESPCAPENNPDCGRIGALPVGCVSSGVLVDRDVPAHGYELLGCRPNPMMETTVIRYRIPEQVAVCLQIHDISGQLVRTLLRSVVSPGWHQIDWNGRDDAGRLVPSGVYFCRLKTGSVSQTRRMTLLR